jgi:hypothetical protein
MFIEVFQGLLYWVLCLHLILIIFATYQSQESSTMARRDEEIFVTDDEDEEPGPGFSEAEAFEQWAAELEEEAPQKQKPGTNWFQEQFGPPKPNWPGCVFKNKPPKKMFHYRYYDPMEDEWTYEAVRFPMLPVESGMHVFWNQYRESWDIMIGDKVICQGPDRCVEEINKCSEFNLLRDKLNGFHQDMED